MLSAETWFGIVFVTIVDVSPGHLKTTILGIFLFLMNNIGGNLPVIIQPVSKLFGYRESLYLLFPGMMLASGIIFTLSVIPLKYQFTKCNSTNKETNKQ